MTSEGRPGPCGHEFDASRGLVWDLSRPLKGRDEAPEDWPRRHDAYQDAAAGTTA
jgi:hypothetical protein